MSGNKNFEAVHAFVDEMWNAGVRSVCISPGSRSTPLTISIAEHGGFEIYTLLDERSSGFFAVGLARRSGRPTALVCTSGTATANYHPAIMEARQSRVPLVVLTADRPPELHDIGQNQTVRQIGMYGEHVKWSIQMPVPDGTETVSSYAAATAWRAVVQATTGTPGPVHVNWPFREPLVPAPRVQTDNRRGSLQRIDVGRLQAGEGQAMTRFALWEQAERPLVVLGPQEDAKVACELMSLCKKMNTPMLADGLSQARSARADSNDRESVVDTYDWFVGPGFQEQIQPDLVVRFGRTPTSKGLNQYLGQLKSQQLVVSDSNQWLDAPVSATDVLIADVPALIEKWQGMVSQGQNGRHRWFTFWRDLNGFVRKHVDEAARSSMTLENDGSWAFEGRIWTELSRVLQNGVNLFVGNSMPVRDLDGFFPTSNEQVKVYANRGVSGIDGVISSAMGTAAADKEPTLLVIGDVSFHHDTNGLYASSAYGLPLVVVLVHNDGGGIFTGLPQADYPNSFAYFETRHGLDYRGVTETFKGQFFEPEDWTEFSQAVEDGLGRKGLTVIQLRTSSVHSTERRRKIRQVVHDEVDEFVRNFEW